MKRAHLYLAFTLAAGIILTLLTINTIHQTRHMGSGGADGWLIFSPAGTLTGIMPLVWLLGLFIVDVLWLLFFIIWIIKHILHIKDGDNTLYLP
jgi:hypothetical protein